LRLIWNSEYIHYRYFLGWHRALNRTGWRRLVSMPQSGDVHLDDDLLYTANIHIHTAMLDNGLLWPFYSQTYFETLVPLIASSFVCLSNNNRWTFSTVTTAFMYEAFLILIMAKFYYCSLHVGNHLWFNHTMYNTLNTYTS